MIPTLILAAALAAPFPFETSHRRLDGLELSVLHAHAYTAAASRRGASDAERRAAVAAALEALLPTLRDDPIGPADREVLAELVERSARPFDHPAPRPAAVYPATAPPAAWQPRVIYYPQYAAPTQYCPGGTCYRR